MLTQVPTTLNGGDVIAYTHALGRGPVRSMDVIVHAPHMCRATDDPERVYVVGSNHKPGTREWGQGYYDMSWGDAVDMLRKRNGWIHVIDDPTV